MFTVERNRIDPSLDTTVFTVVRNISVFTVERNRIDPSLDTTVFTVVRNRMNASPDSSVLTVERSPPMTFLSRSS